MLAFAVAAIQLGVSMIVYFINYRIYRLFSTLFFLPQALN